MVETLELALDVQTFSKNHYLEFKAPQTNISSKHFKFIFLGLLYFIYSALYICMTV